jgi:thiamine pyrophosphate-dependent acetolactate synthase large subunit-like protein
MFGADLFGRALKEQGAEVLFYMMGMGGPDSPAVRSMIEAGIKDVYIRHEGSAAMAAHAYARVAGKPAVVAAPVGPGTSNMISGVANAYFDCAPMIVLAGGYLISGPDSGFHEQDHVGMFKPVTKEAMRVESWKRIPEFIQRAYRIATHGRKGPVFLEIPTDLFFEAVDPNQINWPKPLKATPKPKASEDELNTLVGFLRDARRPVIAAGSGIIWSGAYEELRTFAETIGVPVATTNQARGVLPESHELCQTGAKTKALNEADLVIAIGTRSNWIWGHFQPPSFGLDFKMVCVNIDANEIDKGKEADLGIIADAKTFLIQATERLKGEKEICHRYTEWLQGLNGKKQKISEVASGNYEKNKDNNPIHPLRLTKEIENILTPDTIFIGDGHECLEFARLNLKSQKPHGFMTSGPNVCMGVGVPMAIGCKMAQPDRPVVVLMGDGGIGWQGMEYETAIRHKLPFVGIVSNNGGFTARSTAGGVGREMGHVRYDKMVEAFGGYGEYVEKPEDIAPALKRAMDSGLPACVNVKVDPDVVGVKMMTLLKIKQSMEAAGQ